MKQINVSSIHEFCRGVIQELSRIHTELQSVNTKLSDLDAIMAMECLGNAALGAADFAQNALCAIDHIDEGVGSRDIYNCRRVGVGVLLTAIDMRAASARTPFELQALSTHTSAINAVCDTYGLCPEDSRRFVQLLDLQHGQDNVRPLRTGGPA